MTDIKNNVLWQNFINQRNTALQQSAVNSDSTLKKILANANQKDTVELALPKSITVADIKDGVKKENKIKRDPLAEYPMRGCAYANEVGAALAPIPKIGANLFKLSWIPALMYFGADIYDKYSRGENKDYSDKSRTEAVKQATFQALASVIIPTKAVHLGQNAFSALASKLNKHKLDSRVQIEVLDLIKDDIEKGKLKQFDASDRLSNAIKSNNVDEINAIKKELTSSLKIKLREVSKTAKSNIINRNFFKKVLNVIWDSHENYEDSANIYFARNKKVKQKKLKHLNAYIEKQVSDIIDLQIDMHKAINVEGSTNSFVASPSIKKAFSSKYIKKLEQSVSSVKKPDVIKHTLIKFISKKSIKPYANKIVGGFAFLAALALPIDYVVEHLLMKKIINPGIQSVANAAKVKSDNK